jgi:hypothetical protein
MFQNLVGRKFGDLTVAEASDEFSFFEGGGWVCQCGCGNIKSFSGNSLIGGISVNCGCITSSKSKSCSKSDKSNNATVTTEPACDDPNAYELSVWEGIIDACYNTSSKKYINYGRKGITVCDRWFESFDNFLTDMGPSPSNKHKLARAYTAKTYEPSCCRWVPITEGRSRNTVSNRYEYNGELLTLLQLSQLPEVRAKGLIYPDLYSRIVRCGWSVEKALGVNMGSSERSFTCTYTYNGVTKSIIDWASEYKVPYATLYNRLMRLKWSFEKAALSPVRREAVYTYNGITKPVSQWAREHNRNYRRFYDRLMVDGWSFERAISTP